MSQRHAWACSLLGDRFAASKSRALRHGGGQHYPRRGGCSSGESPRPAGRTSASTRAAGRSSAATPSGSLRRDAGCCSRPRQQQSDLTGHADPAEHAARVGRRVRGRDGWPDARWVHGGPRAQGSGRAAGVVVQRPVVGPGHEEGVPLARPEAPVDRRAGPPRELSAHHDDPRRQIRPVPDVSDVHLRRRAAVRGPRDGAGEDVVRGRQGRAGRGRLAARGVRGSRHGQHRRRDQERGRDADGVSGAHPGGTPSGHARFPLSGGPEVGAPQRLPLRLRSSPRLRTELSLPGWRVR